MFNSQSMRNVIDLERNGRAVGFRSHLKESIDLLDI